MTVSIPTVHLNGTSGDELLDQWLAVMSACDQLQVALSNARPHGRDYYPQFNAAFRQADNSHRRRHATVHALRTEAEEIALGIAAQLADKAERLGLPPEPTTAGDIAARIDDILLNPEEKDADR